MTELRRLTNDGIERARTFLEDWGENPEENREPPEDLLSDERYSRPFDSNVEVELRSFETRRAAAEYLSPRLDPIKHRITDDAGVWSWLGMYYFRGTAPLQTSRGRLPGRECFVFSADESTTELRRSYQRRYRHYLRGAWRLYEQHGEEAAVLLNEPITSFNDLADRILSNFRIFNSVGVVPLLLRLYTDGDRTKPGFSRNVGGLRHLIRVLDQLERTYDVYGMSSDALLGILPEPIRQWDNRS